MLNQKFKTAQVVGISRRTPTRAGYYYIYRLRCGCGQEFDRPGASLRRARKAGVTVACPACLLEEARLRPTPRHKHPLYSTWHGILSRAHTGKCRAARYYKDRGVTVDPRWLGKSGFDAFVKDMGPRPEGCTVDRVDPTGPYAPENCRWATDTKQARNRRDTQFITVGGVQKPLIVWAEELGMSDAKLRSWLSRVADVEFWMVRILAMTPEQRARSMPRELRKAHPQGQKRPPRPRAPRYEDSEEGKALLAEIHRTLNRLA